MYQKRHFCDIRAQLNEACGHRDSYASCGTRRDEVRFELNPSSLREFFSQNSHSSVSGSHMSAFLHCIRELNRSSLNVVKTRTVCSSGGLQRSNSLAERTYVFAELQPWLTARPPLSLHPPDPPSASLKQTPLCPLLISALLVFSVLFSSAHG